MSDSYTAVSANDDNILVRYVEKEVGEWTVLFIYVDIEIFFSCYVD